MSTQYDKVPEYLKTDVNVQPINSDDLHIIPNAEIAFKGICGDHINSCNDFIQYGSKQIMMNTFTIQRSIINERNKTEEDRGIDSIDISVEIDNINMKPPTTNKYASSKEEILTPKTALLEDKTYASAVYADLHVTVVANKKDKTKVVRTATVKQEFIVKLPIAVGTVLCTTANKSKETLIRMEEDPSDIGGQFIIKGNEWINVNIESTAFNGPKFFRNLGYKNEIVRMELISKPGDGNENSAQLFVKLLTNNQLVVIIDRQPFAEIQIPFFLMFKLLGWSNDKQIVDWIVYGEYDSDTSKFITGKLQAAFRAKYINFGEYDELQSRTDILKVIIGKLKNYSYMNLSDENTLQFALNKVKNEIDTYLLPMLGFQKNNRHEKALYLTQLIRKLFLVERQILPETDRDSYNIKRAHSAGVTYAKAFKQQYNLLFVQRIKKQFGMVFKNTSFSKVDLVQTLRSAIDSADFERSLAQAITTGTKTQITLKMGKTMRNHLTSQQLHRKNQLNYILSLRQINTPNTSSSKQSNRAVMMRKVQASYTGFICPVQTQDGENVGINKQLAISASITTGSSSVLLKEIIMSDPDFIPLLTKITPQMLAKKLSHVFVNGHWIGNVEQSCRFVDKYRELRRDKKIHTYTTVSWDPLSNEINFWVDTGRLTRPLLIVYNNYGNNYIKTKLTEQGNVMKNPKREDFKQWIALTDDVLTKLKNKEIDMSYLLDNNIIEYISPNEQENLVIAKDYDTLWADSTNPLNVFTHCDIPPALLGFAALLCPLGTHAPVGRVVLACAQSKQACGWFSLAWPFRIDKESFLQHACELPIVKTIATENIQPNGVNCIIAVAIYSGYNQEDSVIINKGAVQRGLFDGVHFTFEKSELDKNEHFGNPDISITSDIKAYASYEKIFDGFPKRGTVLYKNDVIIGKVVKNTGKQDGEYKYSDRSSIYKSDEPAIVFNVIVTRNQEGKPFAKVHLMIIRNVAIGDKFSMRSGQKGVAGMIMEEEDMPFTKTGMVPDFIFNPHSLPSRMTVNTLLEVVLAKVCALKGVSTDGTIFRKTNIPNVQAELKTLGFNSSGTERLYNGMTGKWIDCEIFIGPVYYQRLQKFVSETIHAVASGSTDVLTRQPLDGKSSNGGLRIGEMEKDVLIGNGVARFLSEKFFDHSDGFRVYICRGCGKYATANHKLQDYACKICKDDADIAEIDSSWSAKLFLQEVRTLNISVQTKLAPYRYESY